VLALFKRYKEKAHGEYVVESSGGLSKPEANYAHYRCEPVFNRLASWLRAHGVSNAKPLHTLRKEYGSALARTLGILAASHGLRHASIGLTHQHYVDSRSTATVGLGHLLKAPQKKTGKPARKRERSEAVNEHV
jgi:hypothetical protein